MNLRTLRVIPMIGLILLAYSIWRWSDIYTGASLLYAHVREDMSSYKGGIHEIERYNEAIYSARSGDYAGAESLLAPLLNSRERPIGARVYELYGDIVYKMDKPRETVKYYYEQSLALQADNLRVEKKLELLLEKESTASGSTQTGSTASGSQDTSDIPDPTVSGEKQEKLQELESFSLERGDYMDYNASSIPERDRILQSSIDILKGGQEQKDW